MTLGAPNPGAALNVQLLPMADRQALGVEWSALEECSEASFFQTWEWLGAFVACLPDAMAPHVLRVRQGGRVVALGLIWRRSVRRSVLLRSRVLHLNETGDARYDGVTIEHNNLLSARGLECEVTHAVLAHLAGRRDWDELSLSGVRAEAAADWRDAAARAGLRHRLRWPKPYFWVDLAQVRAAGGSYLDSLSANTRYQARRACRLHVERGELRCEHASTEQEAMEWLRALIRLHQTHWRRRGQPGAFGSEFAVRFHECMVRAAWPRGRVQIVRISAGAEVIGYLYNFVRDAYISNYQTGHIEDANSKLKPGLVCHCVAVEDALARGFAVYDLLMGGEHFKPSLTNGLGTMEWGVVQRRRLGFLLEDGLRVLRDRMRGRSGPQRPNDG